MSEKSFIPSSFKLFFSYKPFKIVALFFVTLLQGLSQGVSIALLVPLLGLLDPSKNSYSTNVWGRCLGYITQIIGVSLNMEVILFFFVICLVAVAILNYAQAVQQGVYQQAFSCGIRKRLFKKIILSDWNFLNGTSKHDHIQILTTEIPKVSTYYYYYLGIATKVIFIISHLLIAFTISFNFTLLVMLIGVLSLLLLRRFSLLAVAIGVNNLQLSRRMLKYIDDFWSVVKIAKIHHSEPFFYRKFEEVNDHMLQYQNKQVLNRAIPSLLFNFVGIVFLIIMVYLAYANMHLSFQYLFVLILLFARIFPQFVSLNSDLNMLNSLAASVRMVLDLDSRIADREFPQSLEQNEILLDSNIEIKNVFFSYSKAVDLFSDFSAVIPAKRLTGVVGSSGSGKTTFIDLLSGLQQPARGQILIDGAVLDKNTAAVWKRMIGYLPQDVIFVDGTIRDNLIMDSEKEISDQLIWDTLKKVNAYQLVKKQEKGLDCVVANYQYYFSGGERQRLALARVLLRCPKLLLLDEATSALDWENERLIVDCLSQLKKEVTIVFVTHQSSLLAYFDHIIKL